MEKTVFESICEKYELATNSKIDPKTICLGDESSWTVHKALESLKFEPNGNLGTLLLYKAWQEQKRDARIKLTDLLSNPTWIQYMQNFEKELNEGDAHKLLENTITIAKNVAEKFNISNIDDLLTNDTTKFIDMFAEAYENIYKKYKVDRFACNEDKGDSEPYISIYEYQFHSLMDFVNCLRNSDNCIVYAKIDGVHDYEDADEYDTFFAFGCRCEDKIYINSDREDYAVPTSRKIKKQRNPDKKLRNKANNTWMPYYDLRENKTITIDSKALTVIDPNIVPPTKICELYDNEAKLIIVLSMAVMYEKYFVNKIRNELRYQDIKRGYAPIEDSYFGEEIKLLPYNNTNNEECKAIIKYNEIQLPTITMNKLQINNPNISCSDVTFFDWYIKEYIREDDILTPTVIDQFIGNKEEAERRVWWQYRHQCLGLVNERRTKEIASMYIEYDKEGNVKPFEVDLEENSIFGNPLNSSWQYLTKHKDHWLTKKLPPIQYLKDFNVIDRIKNNLPNILKILLEDSCRSYILSYTLDKGTYFDNLIERRNSQYPNYDKSNVADNIDDENYPYYHITTLLKSESESCSDFRYFDNIGYRYFNKKIYDKETESFIYYNLGNLKDIYGAYKNEIIILPTKTKNKNYTFKIKANCYWDLCALLGCKRSELPKPLQ